ncbi:alpha/beta hydrolase [Chachezhania antarctica]|uniref:alpha/beta hydrolase n=1 Tax=Chachezhania antarctica TaxID=2340860 RepID=UPI000EB48246|nr:alpha/beta hydrolase [Chachezhania antarctica]|tara:strand:- start:10653 stop:12158 length:1506 start_codon:yes stop_codon:yes gene_type:complete
MNSGVSSISVLGELRVCDSAGEVALPASRKARALLAFLVTTDRPHRRERLCEMFWDLPDDPKAALRWALSKLRKSVDTPDRVRIIADRERVRFDSDGLQIDLRDIRRQLREGPDALGLRALEQAADLLGSVVLDGLDGAGDDAFGSWLMAERQDAAADRTEVLRRLVNHPEASRAAAEKWSRLWHAADPDAARATPARLAAVPVPETATEFPPEDRRAHLREQQIGFCRSPDDATIAYAAVGKGPPLVKAANWLTHIEHDWNTPIWGACFADIARDRTFVRYDERGCGLSDWDVGALDFDAFVTDLETVVDKLGLGRFPLLGISQGAAVCVEYAVRHPDRVLGLILIGGYASGWRHHATAEEIARREAVRQLTTVGWGTENPAYRHIFSQTFMPSASPEDLLWFDEFQRLTTSAENAARFQDAFGEIDVRDRLRDIRAPTIVLHALGDRRIPVEQGRFIASEIPDARFVPLDSDNHVLVEYEPAWTACMGHIRSFLADHGI